MGAGIIVCYLCFVKLVKKRQSRYRARSFSVEVYTRGISHKYTHLLYSCTCRIRPCWLTQVLQKPIPNVRSPPSPHACGPSKRSVDSCSPSQHKLGCCMRPVRSRSVRGAWTAASHAGYPPTTSTKYLVYSTSLSIWVWTLEIRHYVSHVYREGNEVTCMKAAPGSTNKARTSGGDASSPKP